jgi:hypothetical protein
MPTRTRILALDLDRAALLLQRCDSIAVHRPHQFPDLKMQSAESSDGNLRLSTNCSAPFSRAYGR